MVKLEETATKLYVQGTPGELEALDESFKFRPNGYFYAPSYDRFRLTGGEQGWDGWTHPFQITDDGEAVILRGRKNELIAICDAHGFEVDGTKLIQSPFINLTLADIPADCLKADFELDSYQRQCVLSWLIHGMGINQMTVGGGKTACYAAAGWMIREAIPEAQFLYVTPAERLVKQVTTEMRKFLPGWDVGQFGGGKDQKDAKDMVVCTVAMLRRHRDELVQSRWFRRFIALFFDECFVAGTQINGVPIEKIRVGDYVIAVDETTWCVAYKRVLHCFKSKPSSLVKVRLFNGKSLVCTPNHPFLTKAGWTPAWLLTKDDVVFSVNYASSSLQKLWQNVRNNSITHKKQQGVLFNRMRAGLSSAFIFSDDVKNKSEVRFGANAQMQPDEKSYLARQSQRDLEENGLETSDTGWKWTEFVGTTAEISSSFKDDYRVRSSYRVLARRSGLSNTLHFRHSRTEYKAGYRSGWGVASFFGCESQRPQEDSVFGEQRVVSVEILQPTSDGTFGGMCPDGYVYNIEVKDWHTYTVDGCVVHNCHHVGSKSAEQTLLVIPSYFRFGASDTAKDSDPARQAKMLGLLGSFLNKIPAAPLINVGRLAMPHIYVEDLKAWRDACASVPFRAMPNSRAWCLIESRWISGVYNGPVYEKDEKGETVYRKRKELRRDELTGELMRDEVTGAPLDDEVFHPVIDSGRHRIQIDGQEHEIESRWVLLNRVYDEAIVRFKARNDLIVRWSKYFSDQGHPTLVVCTRTLHIYLLEAALIQVTNPELVRILFGWSTPKERDESFEWYRSTPGSILITPLIREGVSIHEIKAGVIADYVGAIEVFNQIVGRFMRKKAKDNFAEIVMFREAQHPGLRRASNRIISQLTSVYGYVVHDPAPSITRLEKHLSPGFDSK